VNGNKIKWENLNLGRRHFSVSIAGVCQNMVFLLWNSDFWVFHSWAIDPKLVCHQWNTYDLTLLRCSIAGPYCSFSDFWVFLLWNSDFWVFHSWAIDPKLVCHQWNTYDLTLQVFHSWAILQFHSWDKSVP